MPPGAKSARANAVVEVGGAIIVEDDTSKRPAMMGASGPGLRMHDRTRARAHGQRRSHLGKGFHLVLMEKPGLQAHSPGVPGTLSGVPSPRVPGQR